MLNCNFSAVSKKEIPKLWSNKRFRSVILTRKTIYHIKNKHNLITSNGLNKQTLKHTVPKKIPVRTTTQCHKCSAQESQTISTGVFVVCFFFSFSHSHLFFYHISNEKTGCLKIHPSDTLTKKCIHYQSPFPYYPFLFFPVCLA